MVTFPLIWTVGAALLSSPSQAGTSQSVVFSTSDRADVSQYVSAAFTGDELSWSSNRTFPCEARQTRLNLAEGVPEGRDEEHRKREITQAALTWTERDPSQANLGIEQEWESPFAGLQFTIQQDGELTFESQVDRTEDPAAIPKALLMAPTGIPAPAFKDPELLFDEGGLLHLATQSLKVTEGPLPSTFPWSPPPGLLATGVFSAIQWEEIGSTEEHAHSNGSSHTYQVRGDLDTAHTEAEHKMDSMFFEMTGERSSHFTGQVHGTLEIDLTADGRLTKATLKTQYHLDVEVETLAGKLREEATASLQGTSSISIHFQTPSHN